MVKDSIKVGCTELSFEKVEQIYNYMKELQKKQVI
jgi:hypothetical protein